MNMRIIHSVLAISAMLMSAAALAAQNSDSAKITALLQHAKDHAVRANLDAEQIEGYTRSQVDWRAHSDQLNRMREDFNELAKDAAALTAARDEGSAWQQEAIDDVNPLLRSMADHLTAMIQHLGDNQNRVHMPPYVDYAKANYELSNRLHRMISDYVDYAEAKAKAEALEQKLVAPAQPNPGQE